jgi:hypothetical protein
MNIFAWQLVQPPRKMKLPFAEAWAEEREGLVFSPSTRTWVDKTSLSPEELFACYGGMINAF